MTEQMQKLRDEKIKEYMEINEFESAMNIPIYTDEIKLQWLRATYGAGFNECAKIYEARVQKLEDLLKIANKFLEGNSNWSYWYNETTMSEASRDVLAVLRDYMTDEEIKAEIEQAKLFARLLAEALGIEPKDQTK